MAAKQVEISAFRRSGRVEQRREGRREIMLASELIRKREKKVIGECHHDSFVKFLKELKSWAIEMTSVHSVREYVHLCVFSRWWVWPEINALHFLFLFKRCYCSVINASWTFRETQKQSSNILESTEEIKNRWTDR